jgi:hypothetical protein
MRALQRPDFGLTVETGSMHVIHADQQVRALIPDPPVAAQGRRRCLVRLLPVVVPVSGFLVAESLIVPGTCPARVDRTAGTGQIVQVGGLENR